MQDTVDEKEYTGVIVANDDRLTSSNNNYSGEELSDVEVNTWFEGLNKKRKRAKTGSTHQRITDIENTMLIHQREGVANQNRIIQLLLAGRKPNDDNNHGGSNSSRK